MPAPPPGWYPDHDGAPRLRWWNGRAWTEHVSAVRSAPVQEAPSQSPEPLAKPARRSMGVGSVITITLAGIAAVVVLIALIGLLAAEFSSAISKLPALPTQSAAPSSPAPPKPTPTRPAAPPKSAEQLMDESQMASGWSVITPGDLYGRWADESEFTCGSYGCSYYLVMSVSGCPSGVYVEANVESNGVVVGMTNDMLGGLQPGQSGAAHLEDYRDIGDGFRVTDVSCY